jgi:integrase
MKVRLRDGSGTRIYKYLIEDVDRHGNVRIYFHRRKGQRKIRLHELAGTTAFTEEYLKALHGGGKPLARNVSSTAGAGTVRWLVALYYASAAYKELGASTRKVRRGILDAICARAGSFRFATMEPRDVAKLRDEKASLPEAANARVKALRQLFAWATAAEYGYANRNPAREVPYLRPKNPDGFHTWTIEEIEQYRAHHPIGTMARLALDLLLFTGVRKSDVICLGPQMAREGWLRFTEAKGRARKPKHREIPILPALRASIDAMPFGHLNYLTTRFGRPFTTNGFGNWFKRRCREADLERCSAHGLRKAGATIAANNGASDRQLMAIYGWTTTKQANVYTKKADAKKLTADAMPLIILTQSENEIVRLSTDPEPGERSKKT